MRHFLAILAASLLLGGLNLGAQSGAHAANRSLVVIVGVDTPLHAISTELLRRTFEGEPSEYASGKRLVPINQALNSPERVQFDRAVLSLEPDAVGPFWVDRRIRDQSGAPKAVKTSELAVRVAMSLVGVITYVMSDELNDRVRALTIDGKKPGEPGYLRTR
jgi:hypothetical protein